jgi:hypothetical protein
VRISYLLGQRGGPAYGELVPQYSKGLPSDELSYKTHTICQKGPFDWPVIWQIRAGSTVETSNFPVLILDLVERNPSTASLKYRRAVVSVFAACSTVIVPPKETMTVVGGGRYRPHTVRRVSRGRSLVAFGCVRPWRWQPIAGSAEVCAGT